jgi:hypothetical protein
MRSVPLAIRKENAPQKYSKAFIVLVMLYLSRFIVGA